jgi:hypothetical protein
MEAVDSTFAGLFTLLLEAQFGGTGADFVKKAVLRCDVHGAEFNSPQRAFAAFSSRGEAAGRSRNNKVKSGFTDRAGPHTATTYSRDPCT